MINFKQLHKDSIFYCLLITVFTFPISNSLKSIFLTLTSLLILTSPELKQQVWDILKKPWAKAILAVFFLILLGLFIGNADLKNKIIYLNKYSKILYLPLLAFAFQDKRLRQFAIHAFLLSILLTVIVSVLKDVCWVDNIETLRLGGPFQNHIDTGLFVAFAAYLAALRAVKHIGVWRWAYVLVLALFTLYILFINSSRTGYLCFSVLFLVFLLQHISWRRLLVYCPLLFLLGGVIALQSPTLKYNVGLALQDLKQFKQGDKNTSVGFRLQFAQYAHKLFLEKPLMGYGTAGFTYQFSVDNPIPDWGPSLGDPHNQYWSFVVDYGLLGLIVLMYFFFTIYQATSGAIETHDMVFALLAAFLMANFCDSFLLLANGGYFFVIFSAQGLGESLSYSKAAKAVRLMGKERIC